MIPTYKIGVLGSWHLGSVYSVVLAELGNKVISFDIGKNMAGSFNKILPPVQESGLAELIEKKVSQGQLVFVDKIKDFALCDIIWLAVDMPINKDGRPDFSFIKKVFKDLVPALKNNVVVVVSSQVPVGAGQSLKKMIQSIRPNLEFSYVYQPENLQLGRALESFFKVAIASGSWPGAAWTMMIIGFRIIWKYWMRIMHRILPSLTPKPDTSAGCCQKNDRN